MAVYQIALVDTNGNAYVDADGNCLIIYGSYTPRVRPSPPIRSYVDKNDRGNFVPGYNIRRQ